MGRRTKNTLLILLPVQILLVLWLAGHPMWVEEHYSNGLYPFLSRGLRYLLGWIPFSVGDLLYTALGLFALRHILKNRKAIAQRPLDFAKGVGALLSLAYFAFHLLWGLNYYRQPIGWKLGISGEYTQEELVALTIRLADSTNHYQRLLTGDSLRPVHIPYSKGEIYAMTEQAYGALEGTYPFFAYRGPSIKASLYSLPLTLMGYSGYLNPFTNEAQVNGLVPPFRLPSISGHEVGHQLGYSAEGATNFIGYLVTSNSPDPYFRYSAQSHALGYCLGDLYQRDPELHGRILASLNPGVRENYAELINFWKKYQNPMEPIFKAVFDTFLKANNQKEGIKSYNAMVGLLINLQKKADRDKMEL